MQSKKGDDPMKRTITNPVFEDEVRFVTTAEESDGEVTELEITLKPGGENDLHYHQTYAETFTAVEGRLGVRLGPKGVEHILEPGQSKVVDEGQIHAFFNPTDADITFKVELKPGHTGFEQSLRIMYGLAHDGEVNAQGMPKSLKNMGVIARLSEMRSPNRILRLLEPLILWLGKRAEKDGTKEELLDRYCR